MSYVRVSILGSLLGTEVWSVNPVFDPTGEFPGGVNQTALDNACQQIANRTVPAQMRAFLSTQASRIGARLEVRDDVTDNLIAISTQTSASAATGSTAIDKTPQSAIVLSLRTDVPGASGRGRLYWPCLSTLLDSNGRVNATLVTSFMGDMKSYLTGIRGDLAANFPTVGFDLAVRSKTTHTTPHVVRLQVGNVVDTQRRRRDALAESYQTTTFP